MKAELVKANLAKTEAVQPEAGLTESSKLESSKLESSKPQSSKSSSYITGHCAHGNCEGTANRSATGALYHACRGTYNFTFRLGGTVVCTHTCHKAFAAIRALIAELPGNEAIVDLPVPPVAKGNLFLPEPHAMPVSTLSVPLSPAQGASGVSAGIGSPKAKAFTPTPSGRAARGELEEQVRTVLVTAWQGGRSLIETVGIGPKAIAASISKDKPPSQGAIHAVLTRWANKNLVTLTDKPFRVMGFTVQGESQLVY